MINNPKQTNSYKKKIKKRYLIYLLCTIVAASLFTSVSALQQKTENGQFIVGQTHTGQSLSHSLDLRLAAKATYPSSPLLLVKDLGISSGIKSQIVSFSVPTDGLTEYGLLMLPTSPMPAAGYPAIILCHGYVSPSKYRTTASYISDMEFYASRGFAVIKPDFRGQGTSTGQGVAEGAYYSMAYNTDVMSLISSLKQTSYVDKSKINLWGHSMGAYIALRASVISKDIKNTILLSGPVGSFKKTFLSYIPPSDINNSQALRIRNSIFSKYGTPAENTDFWINASPINFLKNIETNIQIHTGLLDSIVPPELSADLDKALTASQKNHQYYTYPEGYHNLTAQRYLIWPRSLAALHKD